MEALEPLDDAVPEGLVVGVAVDEDDVHSRAGSPYSRTAMVAPLLCTARSRMAPSCCAPREGREGVSGVRQPT